MSTESVEQVNPQEQSEGQEQQAVQEPDTGTSEPGTGEEVDWKAEAEKWKGLARKHDERAKTNHKAAEELKTLRDQGKSELERAQERAEAAESRLSELETSERRSRIAAKFGISELAHRLNGDEDEMSSFAKELAKFKSSNTRDEAPSFDGGPRTPSRRAPDMNDLIRGTLTGR